jgi:hypothetical protein
MAKKLQNIREAVPGLFMLILGALVIGGCSVGITRQETDIYTITEQDTTTLFLMNNAPGERDNGIIYPSSRTFRSSRYLVQRDSVVDRFYPNFIRLGVFESVGLMLGGDRNYSQNSGLFGIFPDFSQSNADNRGDSSGTFLGSIYRFGIGEWRLRWFRDAKNWTVGTSMIEVLAPDARIEKQLMSVFPLYVRKRYFLREEIPYVAITPAVGFGYYPSQYVNTSVSLDVGSISGLNLRLYAGFAAGINSKSSYSVENSDYTDEAQSVSFPYFGIGISFLDFLNIVPETEVEWKDHEHSGWNIGLAQVGINSSTSGQSAFVTDSTNDSFIKGFSFRLLNTVVALPIKSLANKLYAGTALLNIQVLGSEAYGMGILPLRIGYWQTLIQDELSLEPFAEYNYYPSHFFNLGARLNLKIAEQLNMSLTGGYSAGNPGEELGAWFTDNFGQPNDFAVIYFGVSLGAFDKIFFPEDLRYNRKDLPKYKNK